MFDECMIKKAGKVIILLSYYVHLVLCRMFFADILFCNILVDSMVLAVYLGMESSLFIEVLIG